MHKPFLLAALLATAAAPAMAGTVALSGTRSNISPGGSPGGRCAPALTIGFAPGSFTASGTSNLGDFSYTASHCIAGPPPGSYYDGVFEWTFANGTLSGTHDGTLTLAGPGLFNVVENLVFTGGTGRYLGASGSAIATGTLQFGQFNNVPASFGNVTLSGEVTAPGVPEPASWAMLITGFGIIGASARHRRPRRATA